MMTAIEMMTTVLIEMMMTMMLMTVRWHWQWLSITCISQLNDRDIDDDNADDWWQWGVYDSNNEMVIIITMIAIWLTWTVWQRFMVIISGDNQLFDDENSCNDDSCDDDDDHDDDDDDHEWWKKAKCTTCMIWSADFNSSQPGQNGSKITDNNFECNFCGENQFVFEVYSLGCDWWGV